MKDARGRSLFAGARYFVFAGLLMWLSNSLIAQTENIQRPAAKATLQSPATAEPSGEFPRNLGERFRDYRSSTFSPWALFTPSLGAGLSQWRNYPPEWKQGGEGFGKRLAVTFQEVVHSSKTREADCDEQSTQSGGPEWTSIRMHDLP